MHLYAAFLGGPLAGDRMGEGHEVVLVVAEGLSAPRPRPSGAEAVAVMSTPCSGSTWSTSILSPSPGPARATGSKSTATTDPLSVGDTARMEERNVLGGELEPCGTDPITGFYRDGCCTTGPEDLGSHTICAVVTAEFLEHQRRIGNDLTTPMPRYRFPGLLPGDRWCVTAANWLRSHLDGAAAYVVLASTHERALEVVPLAALEEHAVDVPSGPGGIEG